METRSKTLDPQITEAVRGFLLDRPDGVARQEISGAYALDAETARAYLRAAGARGHGGRGARWYLHVLRDEDPGAGVDAAAAGLASEPTTTGPISTIRGRIAGLLLTGDEMAARATNDEEAAEEK